MILDPGNTGLLMELDLGAAVEAEGGNRWEGGDDGGSDGGGSHWGDWDGGDDGGGSVHRWRDDCGSDAGSADGNDD
jgi:hypothetical protein